MRRPKIYPIVIAVADGIVTELYKVIEVLRADLHYRRHRGAGGDGKSARPDRHVEGWARLREDD